MKLVTIGHLEGGKILFNYPKNVCCGCGGQASDTISVSGESRVKFSLPICKRCLNEEARRKVICSRADRLKSILVIPLALLYLASPIVISLAIRPLDLPWPVWLVSMNVIIVIFFIVLTLLDKMNLESNWWSGDRHEWPSREPIVRAWLYGRELKINCQDVYARILEL